MRLLMATFLLLLAMMALAGFAHAQYVPIPNEQSGSQCPGSIDQCSGFKIRSDINNKFSALGASDCQWTANGWFQCTRINGVPIATGTQTVKPAGSQGQGQYNTGLGLGGTGAALYADAFSGADWCAKVAATQVALTNAGLHGTIDARGLAGAQSCANGLVLSNNNTVLVGATTLTVAPTKQILLNQYASLIGLGPGATTINGTVVGDAVVRNITGQSNVTFGGMTVYNSDHSSTYTQGTNSGGSTALRIDSSLSANVYNMQIQGGYYAAMITGGSYYGHWSSIEIDSQSIATVGLYINEASDQTFDKLAISGVAYGIDEEWAFGVTVNNFDCEHQSTGTVCIVADRETQPGGAGIAQMVVNGGYEQNYNYLVDAEDSAGHGANSPSILVNNLHLQGIGIAACTGPFKSNVVVISPAYGAPYTGCTTLTTDATGGMLIFGNVPSIDLYDGTNTVSLVQNITDQAVLRDQNNARVPLSLKSLSASTTITSTTGTGTTPAALSTFGTCNSSTEGYFATQTNSTAACSLGATATSSGTTHCAIYCNGTNWIQLGF